MKIGDSRFSRGKWLFIHKRIAAKEMSLARGTQMQNNISFKGAEYRDDFRERAAIAMPRKRRVTPLELISYPRLRAPPHYMCIEHKSDGGGEAEAGAGRVMANAALDLH